MTTRDRPSPPADLDQDGTDALAALEDRDAEQLRAVGAYLEALAAWKESTAAEQQSAATTEPETSDEDAIDGTDAEYPPDVPEQASVTIKEIAGTTYTYYQWRDGDRIESKTVQRE